MSTKRPIAITALALVLLVGCGHDRSSEDDRDPSPHPTAAESLADETTTTIDAAMITLDVAWTVCTHGLETLYAEAGTRNKLDAAIWYSRGSKEEYQDEAIEGYLAGLNGEPNPAEQP